jgi:hypothetical protein
MMVLMAGVMISVIHELQQSADLFVVMPSKSGRSRTRERASSSRRYLTKGAGVLSLYSGSKLRVIPHLVV